MEYLLLIWMSFAFYSKFKTLGKKGIALTVIYIVAVIAAVVGCEGYGYLVSSSTQDFTYLIKSALIGSSLATAIYIHGHHSYKRMTDKSVDKPSPNVYSVYAFRMIGFGFAAAVVFGLAGMVLSFSGAPVPYAAANVVSGAGFAAAALGLAILSFYLRKEPAKEIPALLCAVFSANFAVDGIMNRTFFQYSTPADSRFVLTEAVIGLAIACLLCTLMIGLLRKISSDSDFRLPVKPVWLTLMIAALALNLAASVYAVYSLVFSAAGNPDIPQYLNPVFFRAEVYPIAPILAIGFLAFIFVKASAELSKVVKEQETGEQPEYLK